MATTIALLDNQIANNAELFSGLGEFQNLRFLRSFEELEAEFPDGLAPEKFLLWDDNDSCGLPNLRRIPYDSHNHDPNCDHGVGEIGDSGVTLVVVDAQWDHENDCSNCLTRDETIPRLDARMRELGQQLILFPVGYPANSGKNCSLHVTQAFNLLTQRR